MVQRRDDRHTMAHEAMATIFKLTVAYGDAVYARQAAAAEFAELDRIEGRLSRHVDTSDIARINRLAGGQSTRVQPDTLECLRIALDVYRKTNGAFDVAYGSTGPSRAAAQGETRFELDDDDHAVRVLGDGLRLDLGGIGKGFALDRMAALLVDWDMDSALLAASTSTLLALGPPPGEPGWAVTFGPEHDLRRATLVHRALSGSGTAVKGSHIIDPRTGQPVQNRLRAWADAPTAAMADALSTAFLVMSEDEIRDYCQRHPEVSAYLLESPVAKVVAIAW